MGAINLKHDIASCDQVRCFLPEMAAISDGLYRVNDVFPPVIWSPINITDGFHQVRTCPITRHTDEYMYPYGIQKHGMVARLKKGPIANPPLSQFHIPTKAIPIDMGHFFNSSIRSSTCKATCQAIPPIPYYPDGPLDETDPKLFPNCTQTENNYKDLPGQLANETREQTVRMMTLHYDVLLKSKRSPEVNITEYTYLQTARTIFEEVCPEAEAPPLLVRSLLRMFRMAVNESSSKYPYRQTGDQTEDGRIKAGLEKCMGTVDQKVEFVYNESTCPKEVSIR